MHLPHPATLILYFIVLATASPIAWPDDKLEEINALRARGVPETEIAARNPRSLTSPSPPPLSGPVSFFGHSTTGTADIPLEALGATAKSPQRKVHFKESVGRRGEEIIGRL
ncbi:MAG: hypothetical protein Q9161_003657 [Pseudevernia consocians]